MSRWRFLALLASLALILSLPTAASAQQIPPPPHVFIGTAWQDGGVAPPGTIVTAFIGAEEKGAAMVDDDGKYEPLFVERGNDSIVTFRVGDRMAEQVAIWEKGGIDLLDLTANNTLPASGPAPISGP